MKPLKLLWEKYKESSTRKKFTVIFVLGVFVLVSGGFGFLVASNLYAANKAFSPVGLLVSGEPREPRNFSNSINGVLYTQSEADKWKSKLPLAVVIENHIQARHQSGLSKADLVYEVLAEGGITRFLAIFLSEDSKLGPIRSNRPYLLDLVKEYGAGYAHVGGSPKGQSLIGPYKIKDLDQFGIGVPTYERSSSRFAPHNVYTSTNKLRKVASAKGYKGPIDIESLKFSDEEPRLEDRPKKYELGIPYTAFQMDVLWKYDRKSNTYLRFNGGKASKDAENNKQLFAKTVIVQFVSTSLESVGDSRLKMVTVGSGKVQIFKDGKVFTGTWKKKTREVRTKFFDKEGREMEINRGKIWVSVVPKDYKLSIKK